MLLHQQRPSETWLLPTAVRLFDSTVAVAWDDVWCGLYYSLSTDRKSVCDDDKYYWVQAEAIATAALLAHARNRVQYYAWACQFENIFCGDIDIGSGTIIYGVVAG